MQRFECMICDRCVSLTFSSPDDHDRVRAWLTPAIESVPNGCDPTAAARLNEQGVQILSGPRPPIRDDYIPILQLEWLLIDWVGGLVPSCRVLHAGCVRVQRHLVVFVAPSGGGKSALTLAAVRGGAEYITDDLVSLTPSRISGFARAIRFKEIDGSIPTDEPWLSDMDLTSFCYTARAGRRTIPIYPGPYRPLASVVPTHPVVVVALERGADTITPMSELERVILLHEAAIARWGEYDGSLGPGPTYRLSWSDPDAALDLLLDRLDRD